MILRSLLMASLIFVSCSREDDGEAKVDLRWFQNQRDKLCQEFDPMTIDRCDRSTFHVLMNAMCSKPIPTEYEFPSGKWNRDINPCYPDASSSETSQDTYLSVVMSEDKAAINRIIAYAEPQHWNTGLPAGGVGNITAVVPLFEHIRGDRPVSFPNIFADHRGHLIALWIWEDARQHNGANAAEQQLLKTIYKETPDSPFFSCLYRRFNKMDQRVTMDKLDGISKKRNTYGWGGSVFSVHYALTVACLEGR